MKIRFLVLALLVIMAVAGCSQNTEQQEETAQNSSIGAAARNAASE